MREECSFYRGSWKNAAGKGSPRNLIDGGCGQEKCITFSVNWALKVTLISICSVVFSHNHKLSNRILLFV
jgi:hypothetical protein